MSNLKSVMIVVMLVVVALVGYSYAVGMLGFNNSNTSSLTLITRGTVLEFMGYKNFSFSVPYGNFSVNNNGSWEATNRTAEFGPPTGQEVAIEIPPSQLPAPSFYNVTTYPWIWKTNGTVSYSVFIIPQRHMQLISFIFYSPVHTTLKFDQPFSIKYQS